jgi:hypothetical protein
MLLTSKIKYQIFLFNYFNNYIKNDLCNIYYKDYDTFFNKHIRYFDFLQKIRDKFKEYYDNLIENIYKNVYNPKKIKQMLENNIELDDVFLILETKINETMYNVF